jgi:hypothetical protein
MDSDSLLEKGISQYPITRIAKDISKNLDELAAYAKV